MIFNASAFLLMKLIGIYFISTAHAGEIRSQGYVLIHQAATPSGSLNIYVANEGAPNERWRAVLFGSSSGYMEFEYDTLSGQVEIFHDEWISNASIDAQTEVQGWAYFPYHPTPDMTIHTNGVVSNPPIVDPGPGLPPGQVYSQSHDRQHTEWNYPSQGSYAYHGNGRCASEALTAVGAFIQGEALIQSARRGILRGSMSGNIAGALVGAGISMIWGGIYVAMDACK